MSPGDIVGTVVVVAVSAAAVVVVAIVFSAAESAFVAVVVVVVDVFGSGTMKETVTEGIFIFGVTVWMSLQDGMS